MTTLKTNMLKKGKKGFTLTELAIVIAVIAILIAVLVPTFTSVINNARRTTAAETAKNALTEYTIETYSAVPDGSYVINGDYCWEVENGSFEVSDNIKPEESVYTTGTIQYSWGSDADSGIKDIELYVSYTAGISSTAAKVIAQNALSNYETDSGNTERVITYIGVPNGTSESSVNGKATAAVKLTSGETVTTYCYYTVSNNAITDTTTTAPTANFIDTTTYAGVIIGYSSESETTAAKTAAEAAAAKADTADEENEDAYLYAKVTVGENTLYFKLSGSSGTYTATIDTSDNTSSYTSSGSEDSTTTTDYTVQLYVKTETAAATE